MSQVTLATFLVKGKKRCYAKARYISNSKWGGRRIDVVKAGKGSRNWLLKDLGVVHKQIMQRKAASESNHI